MEFPFPQIQKISIIPFLLVLTNLLPAYAEERQFESDDSSVQESSRDDSKNRFFASVSAGFPQLVGLRIDWALAKSADLRPDILLTAEGGMTLGFYANFALEKRLGGSPFYAGAGYSYNLILLGGSGGEVAWSGVANLDAAMLFASYRTTYRKPSAWCFSLGIFIAPEVEDNPVLPLVKVSFMRRN